VSVIAQAWQDQGPDGAAKALESMRQAQPSVAHLMATDPPAVAVELLTALPRIEYDRIRDLEAKALGCLVSTLDREVTKARGEVTGTNHESHGQPIAFDDDNDELWPEPVDGAILLTALAETFRRYVALLPGAAEALALWVLHAHTIDAADISPMLALQSPQKRCGKTTTLQILSAMVPRPLPCGNITAAAVFS
jgi:putative DNA primase/helicase